MAADNETVISATEASRTFSDILSRVCYGGESFVIKKGQRLMARIVPVMEGGEASPSPAVATAMPSQGVTPEEEEYFLSVLEQIRKNQMEPCE